MELTYNINEYVWVRLTDHGRKYLETRWNATMGGDRPFRLMPEVNGWSKWQMWTLMCDLGPAINRGGPLPFETTISFSDPNK